MKCGALVPLGFAIFMLIGCRATEGLFREGVYQTDAAKTLALSERAVMEQPDRALVSFGSCVRLSGMEGSAFSNEYWGYPGLHVPEHIELSPGTHKFHFLGGSSSASCWFEIGMQAGHVYRPVRLEWAPAGVAGCMSVARCLHVRDVGPTGETATVKAACGPAPGER
jgi:hypothetical protein